MSSPIAHRASHDESVEKSRTGSAASRRELSNREAVKALNFYTSSNNLELYINLHPRFIGYDILQLIFNQLVPFDPV